MKKTASIIMIIILGISFMTASHAQSKQPSKADIEKAIAWAEALGGEDVFPMADGSGTSPALMQCLRFTAQAYGGGESSTAYITWLYLEQHPGDWDPPRGSLVFFDRNDGNKGLGHVALCTGDGQIIEAGNPRITTGTIASENKNAPYLGWAWPPAYWGWSSWNSGAGNTFIILAFSLAGMFVLALGTWMTIRRQKKIISSSASVQKK